MRMADRKAKEKFRILVPLLLLSLLMLFVYLYYPQQAVYQTNVQHLVVRANTNIVFEQVIETKKLSPSQYLFHLHIPKCGGTTIVNSHYPIFNFSRCSGASCCSKRGMMESLHSIPLNASETRVGKKNCKLLSYEAPYESVMMSRDKEGILGVLPFVERPFVFTFFREPKSWAVSAAGHDIARNRYSTLEEGFYNRTHYFMFSNLQTRFLSLEGFLTVPEEFLFYRSKSKKPKFKDVTKYIDEETRLQEEPEFFQAMLERAKERINSLEFIGLVEYFDASICLLQYTFQLQGWEKCRTSCMGNSQPVVKHSNVKSISVPYNETVLEEFAKKSSLDVAVYNYALSLFKKRVYYYEAVTGNKLVCS